MTDYETKLQEAKDLAAIICDFDDFEDALLRGCCTSTMIDIVSGIIMFEYEKFNNMLIQIVSTEGFIDKLTSGNLSKKQRSRVCATLRAQRLSFYDDFSKDHCSILSELHENKFKVIEALKNSL